MEDTVSAWMALVFAVRDGLDRTAPRLTMRLGSASRTVPVTESSTWRHNSVDAGDSGREKTAQKVTFRKFMPVGSKETVINVK